MNTIGALFNVIGVAIYAVLGVAKVILDVGLAIVTSIIKISCEIVASIATLFLTIVHALQIPKLFGLLMDLVSFLANIGFYYITVLCELLIYMCKMTIDMFGEVL